MRWRRVFSWSFCDDLPQEIILELNRLNINGEIGCTIVDGVLNFVLLVHYSGRMMKKLIRFGLTYERIENTFVDDENYIVNATDWDRCFSNLDSDDLFGGFKVSILLCRCNRNLKNEEHDEDDCVLFRSQLSIVKEALLLEGYETVRGWNSPIVL